MNLSVKPNIENNVRIGIIGAGAAGCMAAILIKRRLPDAIVEIFEGGTKPLAKVAITGGGRCNLTNSFQLITQLRQAYPRGEQLMKRALRIMSHEQTMAWYEAEGVRLVTQDDQCVFPASQDAMEIVGTLISCMKREDVQLHFSHRVNDITTDGNGYCLSFADAKLSSRCFDKIVCTLGGCPTLQRLSLFSHLPELKISDPVPSLFTFCINDKRLTTLMGCVVDPVSVSLAGTKLKAEGALLITHWGVSGPAILRLSSYAARLLAEKNYHMQLCINWLNASNEQEALDALEEMQRMNGRRQIGNEYPRRFTAKLWQCLLSRIGLDGQKRWAELSRRDMNRLCSVLTSDIYQIEGKGQYKDEFVTCGGIDLKSVNISTLEAHAYPGLFFAGEVLDVDGITGGFNLQAAWSMAAVVAANV